MALTFPADALHLLKNEAGGHRIQRIPPTERRGRVHTSTVTVAVVPSTQRGFSLNDADLEIEWYSGSGAGGQHRNKHQNSCRVRHRPTGIMRSAQTRSRQNSLEQAKAALAEDLQRRSAGAAHVATNTDRKQQVGSGLRGDKRRTYRFQEDRVVDHVTGKSAQCSAVLRGQFDQLWV
jgi:peptide chain release factor 1